MKNGTFSILLCNKINFDPILALFPPLSAAPHSPRGIQNTPKNVLRSMRSGLTKVEKLQFWQGFEPTLILKNQKLSINDMRRLQDSISGPLACKSDTLPLGYASPIKVWEISEQKLHIAKSLLMLL